MALHIYRRHRRDCKAAHVEDSLSSEFEERKKGWKRCQCAIHVSGTLSKKYRRQTTGQWEWDDARRIVAQWEAAGEWDAAPSAKPGPSPAPLPIRISISDATDAFMEKVRSRGFAVATNGKYRTFVKQLNAFATNKGYIYLDQLSIPEIDAFYDGWADGKRAKARKLHKLQFFMQFCLKRKWIAEDLASDLEPPTGHSIPASKSPFTDEEINRILAACDKIGDARKPGPGYREWTGEDVKDFIYVMLYTGMRISDVATFDISLRLNGNEIFLRMHKTQKPLFSWVPQWLVNRLREREKTHGPKIFGLSKSHSLPVQTERWRLKLKKVFDLAGPFTEHPTPHRMRHTFVRMLLERGVPVGDVAELVGDTERVLVRYYNRWMPSRQQRLSQILKDAFSEQIHSADKLSSVV